METISEKVAGERILMDAMIAQVTATLNQAVALALAAHANALESRLHAVELVTGVPHPHAEFYDNMVQAFAYAADVVMAGIATDDQNNPLPVSDDWPIKEEFVRNQLEFALESIEQKDLEDALQNG